MVSQKKRLKKPLCRRTREAFRALLWRLPVPAGHRVQLEGLLPVDPAFRADVMKTTGEWGWSSWPRRHGWKLLYL